MKEPPKKGSELSKCDEEGVQVAKRDASKAVKAAKAKPSAVDSDIQGTGDGSEDDNDGAGNFDGVGGEDLDSDGDQRENSGKTRRKSSFEGTTNKKKEDRDNGEDKDLVGTWTYKHFTRSKRKLTIVVPKLKLSQVEMGTACRSKEVISRSENVTCRSKKVEKDDVDEDSELVDFNDDDNDDGDYDADDGDDDWKPDQEDEGMEQEDEEEEEKMETDGAKEGSHVPAEGQEAHVCQKCAAIFYTTWDYDLHAIDCTLADRTEYKCDMCRRKCATKWGITYHLVAKHKMSGTEASAKVPELDVRKMKNKDGKRKRSRRRGKSPDAIESSAREGSDNEEKQEEVTNGDKEIEKNQLEEIVDNTLEHMCVQGSEEVAEAANENDTRGPSDVAQKDSQDPKKTCKVCFMELPSRNALYVHTRKVHLGLVEEYKCSTCGKDFTKRVSFKNHVKMHWEKAMGIKYKCDKCDKAFMSSGALTNHRVVHKKGTSSFKCDECDKVFTYNSALYRHVQDHHKRTRLFPCSQCDRVFFQKFRLTDHIKTHSDLREWQCDLCEKAFHTRGSLLAHKKAVHPESGPFLCDLCGTTFKTKSSLSMHCMEQHEGVKNYQCSQCGKRFSRSSQLKRHEVFHTVHKPHRCNNCDKEFRFLYEYYAHVNEHKGIEQFTCTVCRKVFSKQSNLKRHTHRIHEKQHNFFCDKCGFGSPQYKLLEKHIFEEHNSSKIPAAGILSVSPSTGTAAVDGSADTPVTSSRKRYAERFGTSPYVFKMRYQCADCGQQFHYHYDYKIHVARHQGIEPLTCKVCNKEFLQKDTYKRHMSIHTMPVIKYKCAECGDGFKSYQKYRRHMADKHSIKLNKNRNPSKTKKLKSSAAEEDNAIQCLSKPDEEEKAIEGDASSQEPILQPGVSTSVIVVEEHVDPTLAIIQMLYQDQHEIQTVQVQTS